MAKRMLIDAAHPEEIRVAILNGSRLEDFDFEAAIKRQIKGNIYLAKVTRVEPSLQAAFVEYGGNRHGFLAFNEIHPDYYRIPVSDRAAFKSVFEPRRQGDAPDTDEGEAEYQRVEAVEPPEEIEAAEGGAGEPYNDADRADEVETDSEPESEHSSDALGDIIAASERAVAQAAQAGDRVIYDTLSPDTAEREVAMVAPAPYDEPDRGGDAERPAESTGEFAGAADTAPAADRPPSAFDTNEPAPFTPPAEDESAGMPVLDIAAAPTMDAGADSLVTGESAAPMRDMVETLGGDETEEAPRPRFRSHRHYKIQEVVKRRQIMLVQVTKEERGNKGAALTTYLSLAGRYCVLMPNTPRGGGVSRKITSMQDRRRLKDLMSDLRVPEGMGVIVRTAGSERSKAEIKRDFEYLLRLWDEIRELTLNSTAPALVYEEGSLIKRSIRDLYARDIEEVVVDGEDGYRAAKSFMKMLMPSHAKRVKPYRDPTVPLFHRHQVESQIDAIHSPIVQLRSGGYIVINPTEALVAIDVNSGRATRERNIEETALKTNLEAAEEVARQLRLRDLAGLIVIDFIDMEESRNAFQVERRVKDSMRNDRARIQIGRISPFGLLELSRQRLRPSLLEASTEPCPHCGGTGHVRSTESTALHVLRAIEEEGMRRRSAEIAVAVPTVVALYLLNRKRDALSQTERRYSFQIAIGRDDTLVPPAFRLDRIRALTPEEIAALPAPTLAPMPIEEDDDPVTDDEADIEGESESTETARREPLPVPAPLLFAPDGEDEEPAEAPPPKARDDEHGGRRRHRRHRGESRGRPPQEHHRAEHSFSPPRDTPAPEAEPAEIEAASADGGNSPAAAEANGAPAGAQPGGDDAGRKRRRRGRRGGRRRRREPGSEGGGADSAPGADEGDEHHDELAAVANQSATESPHFNSLDSFGDENDADVAQDIPATETPPEPEHRPDTAHHAHRAEHHPATEHRADTAEHHAAAEPAPKAEAPAPEPAPPSSTEAAGPARSGWWRRR